MQKNTLYIPNELLDIIFSFDGRLKYRKGEFINIISKNDTRYTIITPIIEKKIFILKNIMINDRIKDEFYFEIRFEEEKLTGLCYDYRWSYREKFEICYYNFKNNNCIRKRIYL
jgi:hypothetical protein